MICSKCGSEISDNAKFCPNCGQKCAPAPLFCTNCGLELTEGSKFCAVCGTPVGAQETKPETMGYAGNVDTPAAASESLVAAMPSAPAEFPVETGVIPAADEIPAGIPASPNGAYAVPTPANSSYAVPTPVNDTGASAFAAAPAANTARVDLAKLADTAGAPADFGDMGFASAAAMPVTPIKKRGGKIGIIIAAAAVAVVAVLAVVFFLNKGPIMHMFMGDSRYASMIEGNGLKSVPEYAGNPVIARGISSAGTSFAAAASVRNSYDTTDYAAHTIMTHGSDATGLAAILEQYESAMLDTYGANSVSVKLGTDIQLTDTAKALLFSGSYDDPEVMAEIEKAISAVNNTTLTYDITAEKSAAELGLEFAEGGLTVNAKAIVLSDGTVYICFPFGSDKAIKYVMDEGEIVSSEEAPKLELDEKEISRLVDEIIDIYLKYYEGAEITVTADGEITAGDAAAHGTLITATLNDKMVEDMFAEIGEHVANDTYFSGKIIDYVTDCGMELTLEEYKKSITDAMDVDLTEEDSIVICSVVDKNNKVLAKSYAAYDDKDERRISYADDDNVAAFELNISDSYEIGGETVTDQFNLSALITKTSETDGSVSLKLRNDDDLYAANIEYSGVKTEKFRGNDVNVGTYVITVTPPADFTEDVSADDVKVLAALSASKLTISSDVNGDALEGSVKIEVPQYGSFAVNMSATVSDGKVDIPSGNTIEITDELMEYLSSSYFMYGYGSYSGEELSDADKAALEQLAELFEALKDKVVSSDSYYAQYLAEALGGTSEKLSVIPEPTAEFDDVMALFERISDDVGAVDRILSDYSYAESIKDKCSDVRSRLYDLQDSVSYSMSKKSLDDINGQIKSIEDEIDAIRKEAEAVEPPSAVQRDYSSMSYEELLTTYSEISTDFILAYFSIYDDDNLADNVAKAYEKAEKAYDAVDSSMNNLSDSIAGGNLSVPKLRDARKKMQAYEEAVNEFIAAVATVQ